MTRPSTESPRNSSRSLLSSGRSGTSDLCVSACRSAALSRMGRPRARAAVQQVGLGHCSACTASAMRATPFWMFAIEVA